MKDIDLTTLRSAKKSIADTLLTENVVTDSYEAFSEAVIILCEVHNCSNIDISINPKRTVK